MPEETSTHEIDTQPTSPEAHSSTAQVRDKRKLPEGVVPKQAQG